MGLPHRSMVGFSGKERKLGEGALSGVRNHHCISSSTLAAPQSCESEPTVVLPAMESDALTSLALSGM